MSFGRNDREYARKAALPDWLEEFAQKELEKNATSPFDAIKNIFNGKTAVESRVQELRDRVGLDLVADIDFEKEITADLDKTASDSSAEKKRVIRNLLALANALEEEGDVENARKVDAKVNAMLADLSPKNVYEAKDDSTPKCLKGCPAVQKFIENLCKSREGHVDVPAILKMLRDERPEDIDTSDDELIEYIKDRIKHHHKDLGDTGDDAAGLEDVVLVVTDEDDGNKEVFDKPAKII